jgi:hypothetical protein
MPCFEKRRDWILPKISAKLEIMQMHHKCHVNLPANVCAKGEPAADKATTSHSLTSQAVTTNKNFETEK